MSSSYSRQRMVQGRTVDMSYLAEAPPPPAVEFDVNCTAAEGQKAIFDMPRLTSERMSFSPGFLPPPRFLGGPPLPASRKSTSRRVFISQMSTAQAPENARGRPGTASCSCQGRIEMPQNRRSKVSQKRRFENSPASVVLLHRGRRGKMTEHAGFQFLLQAIALA